MVKFGQEVGLLEGVRVEIFCGNVSQVLGTKCQVCSTWNIGMLVVETKERDNSQSEGAEQYLGESVVENLVVGVRWLVEPLVAGLAVAVAEEFKCGVAC
jgi:hypothetical protein